MADKKTRDEGAVFVEMALILPFLVMLLVGIVEFGRAYNTQISIQAAAREGARVEALRKPGPEQAVRDAAPSVVIDSIVVTPCPDSGDGVTTVIVTESFTFGIPFVPLGTKTLSATATMRCGV